MTVPACLHSQLAATTAIQAACRGGSSPSCRDLAAASASPVPPRLSARQVGLATAGLLGQITAALSPPRTYGVILNLRY